MEQAKETKLPALLGVFEVHPDHRVRCQAPECTRTVYKRIHVVREEDGLHVYGSDCFERLFIGQSILTAKPVFTDKQPSRVLTEDERLALVSNTELFIEYVEQLYEIDQEQLRQQLEARAGMFQERVAEPGERFGPTGWTPTPDPDETPYVSMLDDKGRIKAHPAILDQAMANIRKRHNVNPELAGWMGLVMHEVKRLQDEVPEPADLFDLQ